MPPANEPATIMAPPSPGGPRLRVAGKFFRAGEAKVFLRGVSYGPFAPNSRGEPFPEDEGLRTDLRHIRALGFDTVRLYELPSDSVLSAAAELGLRLIVGIPWTDHVDFLRESRLRREIEERVTAAISRLKGHPCVAAFLIGNEIEKTLVRWMGPLRVQHFLQRLIARGRAAAPDHLFSYATYPSTEYLIPNNADFVAVNLFLEDRDALTAYLQRLQNLAGARPLLISEFGIDVAAHGTQVQAEAWRWFQEECQRAAVAGTVWFSFTDEWQRGGQAVTEWQFGLVDAARRERAVCAVAVAQLPAARGAPSFSVIVCTHNGTATLRACLQSLTRLRQNAHEILLIDDGSTEDIAAIAREFPQVRLARQEHAGLSVARNLGASLATGDILAYTDDDCIADEDWLAHLGHAFEDPACVAAGGPNIPPPPRNRTEAIVAAAPGAPAHVLLNDSEAEHLPGCNLAIRRSALAAIGGFRAHYRVAGDDVDICWRLQEAGGRLRFVPGAMVWHHRRYRIRSYLRQQRGYGDAEALLMKDHPRRFGPLGGARWRGSIYGDRQPAHDPVEGSIHHGQFGNGLFQGIYYQGRRCWLEWLGGVLWIVFAAAGILAGQGWMALLMFTLSVVIAICRARQLPLPPFELSWRGRLLLLTLCWLQPIVREWARLTGMIRLGACPARDPVVPEVFEPQRPAKWSVPLGERCFWSQDGKTRHEFLREFHRLVYDRHLSVRLDDGWQRFDVETQPESPLSRAVVTVTEYHGHERSLTRVRALLRVAPWGVLVVGVLLGLVLLFCIRAGEASWAAVIVAVMLGPGWAVRQSLLRWIHAAALRAGLDEVTSKPSGAGQA